MVGSKNKISFIHCEKAVSLLRWFSAECVCKLFRKNRRNSSFSAEYICNNLYWFNFCGIYLEIFGGKKVCEEIVKAKVRSIKRPFLSSKSREEPNW
jgi:hypothetical protein